MPTGSQTERDGSPPGIAMDQNSTGRRPMEANEMPANNDLSTKPLSPLQIAAQLDLAQKLGYKYIRLQWVSPDLWRIELAQKGAK